ncbi:uncharacterized protein LOC128668857 [Microplitis demolitor]|uniref:uncharacterized protein LOC128668857 n=1 Tax=Microplitis demolitor TaxID=69319 RepID=UPI00235B5D6B|nr:uncharacterized protein LOC128668857 [Microplitis demolitor]
MNSNSNQVKSDYRRKRPRPKSRKFACRQSRKRKRIEEIQLQNEEEEATEVILEDHGKADDRNDEAHEQEMEILEELYVEVEVSEAEEQMEADNNNDEGTIHPISHNSISQTMNGFRGKTKGRGRRMKETRARPALQRDAIAPNGPRTRLRTDRGGPTNEAGTLNNPQLPGAQHPAGNANQLQRHQEPGAVNNPQLPNAQQLDDNVNQMPRHQEPGAVNNPQLPNAQQLDDNVNQMPRHQEPGAVNNPQLPNAQQLANNVNQMPRHQEPGLLTTHSCQMLSN